MASLREYRDEQLAKLAKLREMGLQPYPGQTHQDYDLQTVCKKSADLMGKQMWLAGRIMAVREHGRITFLDLADNHGHLQLIVEDSALRLADHSNNELQYEDLQLLTRGDFINVHGRLRTSKRGELSLVIDKLCLLCKVLRPLPQKLSDVHVRRRRRYLDLAINSQTRRRFERRSVFWQAVRDFLNAKGFLEINTPILEHTTGGADAQPFKTHMQALDEDFYLRISHELPLKRLLGGGYDKVYDIGSRFRNEHYSEEHLPEHVAMEWYWAYADWNDGMNLTEEMLAEVCQKTFKTKKFVIRGHKVDLSADWQKLDYAQVMQEHYQLDIFNTDIKAVNELLQRYQVEVEKSHNLGAAIDKLFKRIRTKIAGPAWLINIPLFMSPLSKANPERPGCAARFQALIGGSELCNGFSELNDPQEQLQRFKEQQAFRKQGDQAAHMLDLDFVEMLEYGMPPSCGLGFSERVFWTLEGVSARDGVVFNHFKKETDDFTKEIYPDLFQS